MKLLTVVAPAFNEEANVVEFIRRTRRAIMDADLVETEILIVDDGSTDRTSDEILSVCAPGQHPVPVTYSTHERNKGIAASWLTGAAYARGRAVCVIDSDLQYQPEEIPRLYRTWLDGKADIVQGARERRLDGRALLSLGWNLLINAYSGLELADNKSGFFVCSRETLRELVSSYRGRYRHWQAFVMMAAAARGYTIQETPTPFLTRARGRSFIDGRAIRTSVECLQDLAVATREYGFRPRPAARRPA